MDVARRYARTHGPFTTAEFAARYGLGRSTAEALLKTLSAAGRLLDGEFRPGGTGREWCDPEVLQTIRRRSLAKLRKEVEPVEPPVLARLVTSWQGLVRRRVGLDALLDAIENLQGAPLPASILESEILSARIDGYSPGDLDALAAAGEVVWRGVESIRRSGRTRHHLPDGSRGAALASAAARTAHRTRAGDCRPHEDARGVVLRTAPRAAGAGFPGETVDALWDLVWKGILTNDTFHALRAFTRAPTRRPRKKGRTGGVVAFRSRRVAPPSAEGRWSLLSERVPTPPSDTQWSTAMAQQLLTRYGVVTREVAAAEGIVGGFARSTTYSRRSKTRDASGVDISSASAQPSSRCRPRSSSCDRCARCRRSRGHGDRRKPIRRTLTGPHSSGRIRRSRKKPDARPPATVGALVVLVNGALAAYIPRGGRQVTVYLPEDEPSRSTTGRALARALADLARNEHRGGLLLAEINGREPAHHPLAPFLIEAGFHPSPMGFQMRRHA